MEPLVDDAEIIDGWKGNEQSLALKKAMGVGVTGAEPKRCFPPHIYCLEILISVQARRRSIQLKKVGKSHLYLEILTNLTTFLAFSPKNKKNTFFRK